MAKSVFLLILVRETDTNLGQIFLLIYSLPLQWIMFVNTASKQLYSNYCYNLQNRCLHKKQKFPPLQVIKSGKELCVHGGR